ncbi:MAG: hypothetical protein ACON32_17255, partial [Pirellulaceae bacterium]
KPASGNRVSEDVALILPLSDLPKTSNWLVAPPAPHCDSQYMEGSTQRSDRQSCQTRGLCGGGVIRGTSH